MSDGLFDDLVPGAKPAPAQAHSDSSMFDDLLPTNKAPRAAHAAPLGHITPTAPKPGFMQRVGDSIADFIGPHAEPATLGDLVTGAPPAQHVGAIDSYTRGVMGALHRTAGTVNLLAMPFAGAADKVHALVSGHPQTGAQDYVAGQMVEPQFRSAQDYDIHEGEHQGFGGKVSGAVGALLPDLVPMLLTGGESTELGAVVKPVVERSIAGNVAHGVGTAIEHSAKASIVPGVKAGVEQAQQHDPDSVLGALDDVLGGYGQTTATNALPLAAGARPGAGLVEQILTKGAQGAVAMPAVSGTMATLQGHPYTAEQAGIDAVLGSVMAQMGGHESAPVGAAVDAPAADVARSNAIDPAMLAGPVDARAARAADALQRNAAVLGLPPEVAASIPDAALGANETAPPAVAPVRPLGEPAAQTSLKADAAAMLRERLDRAEAEGRSARADEETELERSLTAVTGRIYSADDVARAVAWAQANGRPDIVQAGHARVAQEITDAKASHGKYDNAVTAKGVTRAEVAAEQFRKRLAELGGDATAPPVPAETPPTPLPAEPAGQSTFAQQVAASMRQRAQEQAARADQTTAPAVQPVADRAGSTPAAGDLVGSRDKPLPESEMDHAPVGAWVQGPKLPGLDTRRQIQDVPIDRIDATEFTSDGDIVPDKRRDADAYAERLRAGEVAPNGRASELPNGKIKLQDGHRRLAAAKAAGAKTIRLAVSPIDAPPAADPLADLTRAQQALSAERAKPKAEQDKARLAALNADVERAQSSLTEPKGEASEPAATTGTLFQRGNGKNNSSAQALRMPDGSWHVRNRKAGRWQPWEQRATFDASPAFGYRETGMPGGRVHVEGVGHVPVRKLEVSKREADYNPLLDLIANSGGISHADAARMGVDPQALNTRRGIKPLFRKEGQPIDSLIEQMQAGGYFPEQNHDAPPQIDHNDAWELIGKALDGETVAPLGDAKAQELAEQRHADAQGPSEADHAPDEDVGRFYDDVEREAGGEHIAPGDEAEAKTLSDLYRDLAAAGVALDDVLPGEHEADGAYAARLWARLKEAQRGTDNQAEGGDRAPVVSGREGGQAESVPGFQLAGHEARTEAPREVASQSGLFAPPTRGEQIRAASESKDATRNGLGRDLVRPEQGDGELLAGDKPKQADVADEAQELTRDQLPADAREVLDRERNRSEARKKAAALSQAQGQADASARGLHDAVERVLGDQASRVEYVRDAAGLPENLRDGVEARNAERDGKVVTAAVYDPVDKRVFILTDVVKTPDRAVWNAMHEIAGHDGLRKLLGDKLDHALQIALQNPTVKALADAIAKDRSMRGDQRMLAAEEALAELAASVGTGDFDHILKRYGVEVPEGMRSSLGRSIENFVRRLKSLLDDLFGRPVFTDEDVRDLLDAAREASRGEGKSSKAEPVNNKEDGGPFYSAALRAINVGKGAPKRGDAATWTGWLDGAVRRGEMKQSERDWLGLDDFIKSRGTVTKQELADFVRENQVQVKDVVLAEHGATDLPTGWTTERQPNGEWLTFDDEGEQRGEGTTEQAAIADAQDGSEREAAGVTKFASYQLPGGENYRELLLTLPPSIKSQRDRMNDRVAALLDKYGSVDKMPPSAQAEVEKINRDYNALSDIADQQNEFRSGHFDQPNILAHVRFNDRTDADGKKVLFVEEIQSDWHQQGRKRGYADTPMEASVREDENVWVVKFADGRAIDVPKREAANADEAKIAAEARRALNPEAGFRHSDPRVPNAPFKSTDEWAMLTFKRMVREAAEKGVDRIAWTTGAQQAERYDLSKHIDELNYNEDADGGTLIGNKDGVNHSVLDKAGVKRGDLADYVGKEMAERLLAQEPNRHGLRTLSGVELKVGGEGMKGFYDKLLPAAVNKWAKRFGGKVGETSIGKPGVDDIIVTRRGNGWAVVNGDNDAVLSEHATNAEALADANRIGAEKRAAGTVATTVHSLDITPAMRDAAMQGQPLFNTEPKDADTVTIPAGRAGKATYEVPRFWYHSLRGRELGANGEIQPYDHRDNKHFADDFKDAPERLIHLARKPYTDEAIRIDASKLDLSRMRLTGQAEGHAVYAGTIPSSAFASKPSILENVEDTAADFAPPERPVAPIAGIPSRRPGEAQADYARRVANKGGDEIEGLAADLKTMRKVGRANFRAMLAKQARMSDVADAVFGEYRTLFDKADRQVTLDSIHQWETGKTVADPDARRFFDLMDGLFADRIERLRAAKPGALKELVENYFPHIWEDTSKAEKWYAGNTKRPLDGNKSFLKQRTWGTIREGMESGLRPVSYNPVDLALLKLGQMDKFITFNEFKNDLKSRGWLQQVKAGAKMPDGYAIIDSPAFKGEHAFVAKGEDGTETPGTSHWNWAVPEPIARDVNNYLSPSLYKHGAWKALRYVQNVLMSTRLGFSMFHAGFTTLDNAVTHGSIGLNRMLQGDVAGALKELAYLPLSPVLAPLEGGRLGKAWQGKVMADPHTQALLAALEEGGARRLQNSTQQDFNNALGSIARKIRRLQAPGFARDTEAGIRALLAGEKSELAKTAGKAAVAQASELLGAVGELSSWLIHQKLVPAQKMNARVALLKFELDRFAKPLGKKRGDYAGILDAMHPDAIKQVAGRVVDNVDDRLGQMNYDNQFWPKIAREVAQATIGAVGWQVGTVRTVTGGVSDLRRIVSPEPLLAPLDKDGAITDANMGRLTNRVTNLLTLGMLMGGSSVLLQYLLTGEPPDEAKDYFFPRTGRKNADGSDERLQFPSYWMDHYKLATHPLQTAEHKLHPSIGMAAEVLTNQDYYGVQIRDEDSGWLDQAGQVADYVAKGFVPYSITGQGKLQDSDASLTQRVGNFFGVTTAPASVSRTKFQAFVAEKAGDNAPRAARTQEQADHTITMHSIEDAFRRGENPDTGSLTEKEIKNARKAAALEVPALRFQRLSLEDKLRAWDMATPKERARYKLAGLIFNGGEKHDRAMDAQIAKLPPEDQAAVREKLVTIQGGPAEGYPDD